MQYLNTNDSHNRIDISNSELYLLLVSNDFLVLPSGFPLEQTIQYLWKLCPTPTTLLYPDSYKQALERWLDKIIEHERDINPLEANIIANIKLLIKEIYLQSKATNREQSTVLQSRAERIKLNSILTDYPICATLCFIDSEPDHEIREWWLELFYRLSIKFDFLQYDHCLKFDQARRISAGRPFSLKNISDIKIASYCSKTPELINISTFFLTRPKSTQKGTALPFYNSDNEYTECINPPHHPPATLHTGVDLEGTPTGTCCSLDIDAEPPRTNLTEHERRRRYLLHLVGIENAIGRLNRKLPLSEYTLTTKEFGNWIQYACPSLLEGNFSDMDRTESAHWFVFFFRLFTGLTISNITLLNSGAKTVEKAENNSIVYKLDDGGSCYSYLRLSSELFKGKDNPFGFKHYYSTNPSFDVELPWPINSLLNLALRELDASERRHRPLYKVFSACIEFNASTTIEFEKTHRSWLISKIKAISDLVPFSVTPTKLYRCFDFFTVQSVPSVAKDYLAQNGGVLIHYINTEKTGVATLVRKKWFPFLEYAGFTIENEWSSESSNADSYNSTFYEQIGSAITLREELIPELINALLNPISDSYNNSIHIIECSQRIALYLHIRTAIELALRPVNNPHPILTECAWRTGFSAVQDKRTHHREERRILVMTETLIRTLRSYHSFCSKLDPLYNPNTTPCLAVFDGQTWTALSNKQVKILMDKYLDQFEAGSFRHIRAQQLFKLAFSPDIDFDQQQLDQVMNHRIRGLDPLGPFSMCSLTHLVDYQRELQTNLLKHTISFDTEILWSTISHQDTVVTSWMNNYINGA